MEYHGLDWPPANPAFHLNVDCRFEMIWANGSSDAHAIVDCYRLDAEKDPGFRSYVDPNGRCCWTNFDIFESFCHCTSNVVHGKLKGFIDGVIPEWDDIPADPQIAVVHEVGHLLGLPHVGKFVKSPACMSAIAEYKNAGTGEGGNDRACYKGNDDYDRLNIMGEGMNLASWNGMCWWLRLAEHTGTTLQGWKVANRSIPPKPIANNAAAAGASP